jgi:glycosyltransferase involved in cell wall biosynthesis
MKIGVWLTKSYKPQEGGGFSYYDILIENIDRHNFSNVEVAFISTSGLTQGLQKETIYIPFLRNFLFALCQKISLFIPSRFISRYKILYEKLISDYLKFKGVKVIFYPIQGIAVIDNFPFVSNNWDIGHRATYAFPEFVKDANFKLREQWYFGPLFKALLIFCESEAGKQEIIKFTGIAEEKIKVLPTFAGRSVLLNVNEADQQKILEKFKLTKNHYFFYPAQFWAHKNHYGLLNAFKIFTEKNDNYKLVFTGSDYGNLKYIQKMVLKMQLQDNVVFAGFVTINEITAFYQNATALVMPSFFGPTNMPLLEALALNCPVLCTDLIGHREIMADAALYFSAINHDQIAERMMQITNVDVRNDLLEKAEKVFRESKFTIGTAIQKLEEHFSELRNIRNCWQ